MFGIDIPADLEPLVTLGTLAVGYWVARFAYEKVRGGPKDVQPATRIEGDYNTVINLIGSKLECAAGSSE